MHSITLRFLASQGTFSGSGRVHGGTVLRWMDDAGFACATAWAGGDCMTTFVGGAEFARAVRPGELVEVYARLAYTSGAAMHVAVEVRSGPVSTGELPLVTHCVAVYTALDADGGPQPVNRWTPESPGDIALAQRVKGHIDAARAAQ